jgi:hypothetical protein
MLAKDDWFARLNEAVDVYIPKSWHDKAAVSHPL